MAFDHETIFTIEATPVNFGAAASQDAGWGLKRLGVKRVILVTDPGVGFGSAGVHIPHSRAYPIARSNTSTSRLGIPTTIRSSRTPR